MEYFRIVKVVTTAQNIQHQLTLSNLDAISAEIFNLETPNQETSNIGGIWGEFTLSRSLINGGVRFALIECPNALCWTITTGYPPKPNTISIHLTINRQEINSYFDEEINEFLDDHEVQLKAFFNSL